MSMSIIDLKEPKDLFELDKKIITFNIEENNTNQPSDNIVVKNITNNYIIFKIQTSKKELYTISPTAYTIIPPLQQETIGIILNYNSNMKLNEDFGKFRFESCIIKEYKNGQDPKSLFNECKKNNAQISSAKLKVELKKIKKIYLAEIMNSKIEFYMLIFLLFFLAIIGLISSK